MMLASFDVKVKVKVNINTCLIIRASNEALFFLSPTLLLVAGNLQYMLDCLRYCGDHLHIGKVQPSLLRLELHPRA